MPHAPRPRCRALNCPNLQESRGYCHKHGRVGFAEMDAARGKGDPFYSSARWKKVRAIIKARDPICVCCHFRATTDIDHIVPRSEGGADWDERNLQGLCEECHHQKIEAEIRARRHG